uniref:TFCFD n=1 Tax=Arundo donax TaxID=35708 RepID=A0A0A9GEK4_ARUDO
MGPSALPEVRSCSYTHIEDY